MELLKIKLYQDLVSYRKPLSFKAGETYPLPPPSTVKGFLHSILNAEQFIPMKISIQGTYASVTNNLQKLYKFGGVRKGREASYDFIFGKVGIKSMVYYVNLLVNVNLIIHVSAEKEILENLEAALKNPSRYPSLGRQEDLVRIDQVSFVKIFEREDKRNGIPIKYPAYIPKNYALENDLFGVNYRLNYYYEIDQNLRRWKQVEVVYVESGKLYTKTYVDEEDDLVFLV
ncbi:type I-B CRISPR-associated protein Cas5b [Thermodesulfovibrio hydrogeniphilus]